MHNPEPAPRKLAGNPPVSIASFMALMGSVLYLAAHLKGQPIPFIGALTILGAPVFGFITWYTMPRGR